MEYSNDVQVIINSLTKEKKELTERIAEIDKVIKRVRYGNLNFGGNRGTAHAKEAIEADETRTQQAFPVKADLKVQAIKIFDILGVASKLSDVRDKYREITGLTANFRETLRNLNRHDILKLIQPKGNVRGLYWIKSEWLDEQGNLKEQHKFDGFDLLYTDDMIEFR